MAFQIVEQLDLESPLNFYAYVGDSDGVEVFLQVETWSYQQITSALSLACLLGHTKCVKTILHYSDPIVITTAPLTHAFTQNHPDIVSHLLSSMDEFPNDNDIYPGMLWAVHCGHSDILKPVKDEFPHFINNKTLESAILSESMSCVEYLVENLSVRIDLRNAKYIAWHHTDLFLAAFRSENGIEVDDEILGYLKDESPSVFQEVLKELTTKRWRQIRSLIPILSAWRSHITDLYRPGGKQYYSAMEDFKASVGMCNEEEIL